LRSTTFLFVYHVHKEAEKKTRRKHEKKNEWASPVTEI
jgi:hypothetical protein